jgi:hypothetical protein
VYEVSQFVPHSVGQVFSQYIDWVLMAFSVAEMGIDGPLVKLVITVEHGDHGNGRAGAVRGFDLILVAPLSALGVRCSDARVLPLAFLVSFPPHNQSVVLVVAFVHRQS